MTALSSALSADIKDWTKLADSSVRLAESGMKLGLATAEGLAALTVEVTVQTFFACVLAVIPNKT